MAGCACCMPEEIIEACGADDYFWPPSFSFKTSAGPAYCTDLPWSKPGRYFTVAKAYAHFLGLEPTCDARSCDWTMRTLKKAVRKTAAKYHPDTCNAGSPRCALSGLPHPAKCAEKWFHAVDDADTFFKERLASDDAPQVRPERKMEREQERRQEQKQEQGLDLQEFIVEFASILQGLFRMFFNQ